MNPPEYKVGDEVYVVIKSNDTFIGTIEDITEHKDQWDEPYLKYWFIDKDWWTYAYNYQIQPAWKGRIAATIVIWLFLFIPLILSVCGLIYCLITGK